MHSYSQQGAIRSRWDVRHNILVVKSTQKTCNMHYFFVISRTLFFPMISTWGKVQKQIMFGVI